MSLALAPDPNTPLDELEGIAARLRTVFRSGRTRPLAWRQQQLEQIRKLTKENAEAFVEALAADLGKPALEAYTTDVGIVSGEVALHLKNLRKWTRPEKVSTPLSLQPGKSYIQSEPLGVALIISPWNYPVQLLLLPLIGAVSAGNCAVLKPSELTPNVSALLAKLVPQYLDPECFVLVEGAVDETTALLEQRWDHIFYTGNGSVGRVVMQAAAKHLTPVTLELGGKSPTIVMADANLDVAARRIAWTKFLNAGQTCVAPDYVLVHESREEELVEGIAGYIEQFYGSDPRQSADFGRICTNRHHDRLVGLLKGGGEVATGGVHDAQSRYMAPTVLRRPAADSAVMSEEIFGPLLPVLPVASLDEAIDFVNERDKPLALYVFSESPETERRVVEETSSGGVCVNAGLFQLANPNLPFGGVGESGMGAYHGKASFDCFSHKKSVLRKSTKLDAKAMYPPHSAFKLKMLKRFM